MTALAVETVAAGPVGLDALVFHFGWALENGSVFDSTGQLVGRETQLNETIPAGWLRSERRDISWANLPHNEDDVTGVLALAAVLAN